MRYLGKNYNIVNSFPNIFAKATLIIDFFLILDILILKDS